jgi:hypothetical protein
MNRKTKVISTGIPSIRVGLCDHALGKELDLSPTLSGLLVLLNWTVFLA